MATTKDCIIYVGRNTVNRKVYVGSSVKGLERIATHKWALDRGKHCNRHLQNAWNKYGGDAFEWVVVECCMKKNRKVREQWWIDHLRASQPRYGYNILHTVRTLTPSLRRSQISRKIWENPQTRKSLGKWARDQWLTPGYRERMVICSLEQWKDSGRRERHQERLEVLWNNSATMQALCERNTARWADPENRKKYAEQIKALWETPEYRAKQAIVMRDRWDDPEYQALISKRRKETWQNPEYRAKISARRKEFHAARRAARTSSNEIV